MPRRRQPSEAQIAAFVSVLRRVQQMGVPLWVILPIGAILLLAVLFRPAIEERLGVSLEPPAASEEAGSPDEETVTAGKPSLGKPSTGRVEPAEAGLDGFLQEVGRGVYESPAGLRYRPGSQQGHRLKHVMAHASDQPARAGPHGVFDADKPRAVLTLIDEAYELALLGERTRTRREQERTIHTVNLGRRIGYVGGQAGNADGRPAARKLRLILERSDVITAYPVR